MNDETPAPAPDQTNEPPVPSRLQRLKAKAILFAKNNWKRLVQYVVVAAVATAINYWNRDKPGYEPIPVPDVPDLILPPDGWFGPDIKSTQDALAQQNVYLFADTDAGKAVMGDDDNVFLWKYAQKARGSDIPPRDQGPVGSCVSFGFGTGIEYLLAVQTVRGKGQFEQVDVAHEVIYAGSRVEVNGGRVPFSGDGSLGSWMVKWVTTGGVVPRGVYGSTDLTTYNPQRCRQWGSSGVPADLKPIAQKNLIVSAGLVRTSAELKKALQQGYPVPVCSGVGFTSRVRDADGFLRAQGSWGHCMVFIGYRGGPRPGFCCMNSWPESAWVSGPRGLGDPPPQSFWVEPSTVDRMLGEGDSWALSGAKGFPKQKLKPEDWIIKNNALDRLFARRGLLECFALSY